MNALKPLPLPGLLALLSLLCLAMPSCVAPSPPPPAAQAETLRLTDTLKRDGYVLAQTTKEGVFTIREYARKGDTKKSWRTLVTVGHAGAAMRVDKLARNTLDVLKRDCPHAKVTLRRLSAKEYFIDITHNGCGETEALRSVVKYMETDSGIYLTSFEMKERVYDEAEFARWRQLISTASFGR